MVNPSLYAIYAIETLENSFPLSERISFDLDLAAHIYLIHALITVSIFLSLIQIMFTNVLACR